MGSDRLSGRDRTPDKHFRLAFYGALLLARELLPDQPLPPAYDGVLAEAGLLSGEKRGRWGHAMPVPGMAALNTGNGSNGVFSVSCVAVGECAAGGGYADGSSDNEAFVVSERRGRWAKAIEVPGTAALRSGGCRVGKERRCGWSPAHYKKK